MLTVSELRDRIADDYPDVAQVSDTAVRFSRVADEKTYAVCYVDVASKLPDTIDALTRYQDSTIGQHYFQGPRSLQWSNYLFFLQPAAALKTKETLHAKHLIEADRAYARKFVLAESALDAILAPPAIEAPNVGDQINVMTTWASQLTQPGLYSAVFETLDLPRRVNLIANAEGDGPPGDLTTIAPARPSEPPPFIKHFKISKYRRFPKQRDYEFGRVNLIVGPNAVGKTSLMEAIELFYCGRTKRDPDQKPKYLFHAIMSDGSEEPAAHTRSAQFFRDRNLEWYGQPEVRTNNLFWSFSLFNFLNTDAAVGIGDSTQSLEENLSSLLVGPDASRVWDNILRLSDELERRVRDLTVTVTENDQDLKRVTAQVDAEAKLAKESDTIKAKLDAMMRKLKWTYPTAEDEEERAASLASALSEYAALAEQAGALAWVPAPATIQGLTKYCTDTSAALETAGEALKKWRAANAARAERETELKNLTKALDLTREARLLIEADVPQRHLQATRQREAAAALAAILAGTEVLNPERFVDLLDLDLKAALNRATTEQSDCQSAVQASRNRLNEFTSLRERAVNLAQRLRAIGEEILQGAVNPNECPLCHTTFGEGELARHIHTGVDAELETTGQALLQRVRTEEAALGSARELKDQVEILIGFATRAGAPRDGTVRATLKLLAERRGEQDALATTINRLESELSELGARNLSHVRFQHAIDQLARLGFPLDEHTLKAAAAQDAKLAKLIEACQSEIVRLTEEARRFQHELQTMLATTLASVEDANATIGRDGERVTTTQTLLAKLATFGPRFPWGPRAALAELLVSCRSVRSIAAELQTALQREAQRSKAQTAALAHRQDLEKRLARSRALLSRLDAARKALLGIKENNSLTTAMQSTLQENRDAIEAIFGRIHAPREFESLGENFKTLMREDGVPARLEEISTGQRAAFALSIFLARNSQLIAAPRVMLIDDPIAHVDDFNALSFLDYLRDLVITGSRQVFFATANDKIAALFERKFDFLGEDYRRFNLSRETA